MPAQSSALGLIAYTLGTVFPFWPVILAEAVLSRGRKVLWAMLVMWLFFFVCFISARLLSVPPLIPLIPEPLNFIVFCFAGAVLLALHVRSRLRQLG